jgi:hypothetical protein
MHNVSRGRGEDVGFQSPENTTLQSRAYQPHAEIKEGRTHFDEQRSLWIASCEFPYHSHKVGYRLRLGESTDEDRLQRHPKESSLR